VRVLEDRPPTGLADRVLAHQDLPALLGHLRQRVVDRVDLDIAPRLAEALAARRQPASAGLVGRLPHGVALVAGHLGDLPAEERAVEALGLLHVTHRDVDVGDVAVGHAASSHRCGRRSATVTRVWHWGPTGAAQFPCYPATQRP